MLRFATNFFIYFALFLSAPALRVSDIDTKSARKEQPKTWVYDENMTNAEKFAIWDDWGVISNNSRGELALALGGGGCFSAVSQLGFMQGLFASNFKLTTFGTSSGGSWGLAMALAHRMQQMKAGKSSFFTQHLDEFFTRPESPEFGKGCMANILDKGTTARHCVFHPSIDGTSRWQASSTDPSPCVGNWSTEMKKCGGCAMSSGGSCSLEEHMELFGGAAGCVSKHGTQTAAYRKMSAIAHKIRNATSTIAPVWKDYFSNTMKSLSQTYHNQMTLMTGLVSVLGEGPILGKGISQLIEQWNRNEQKFEKYAKSGGLPFSKDMPNPLQTMQHLYSLVWKEFVYVMYYKDLNMPKDLKVGDLKDVLADGRIHWGIYWSHIHVPAHPLEEVTFSPRTDAGKLSGGDATDGGVDKHLLGLVATSGDASSAGTMAYDAYQAMSQFCDHFTKVLKGQTAMGEYPFPYSPVPSNFEFVWSKPKHFPHFGDADFYADGCATDNNAVGETIRVMEGVPETQRPATLVSSITGFITNNPLISLRHVFGYFKQQVKYVTTLYQIPGMDKNCDIENVMVNNPTHFFEVDKDDSFGPKSPLGSCTREQFMNDDEQQSITRWEDAVCSNMFFQGAIRGLISINDVKVVQNNLFKIGGAWRVNVHFTILAMNKMSDEWVNDVYADNPLKESFARFPIFEAGTFQMAQIWDPKDAFALMQYNALKGYAVACKQRLLDSKGMDVCEFCKQQIGTGGCFDWFSPVMNMKLQMAPNWEGYKDGTQFMTQSGIYGLLESVWNQWQRYYEDDSVNPLSQYDYRKKWLSMVDHVVV